MNNNIKITSNNLPLQVREHLMRGQVESAIKLLEKEYGKNKEEANALIENYRSDLRERKIELDIQIMNEQNKSESSEKIYNIFKWGIRLLIVLIASIIIYLLTYI